MRSIILPYQAKWAYDRSPLKVAEKSRQIGWTWVTAYEMVIVAAARKEAGGMDCYYMPKKEHEARKFIARAKAWAQLLSLVVRVKNAVYANDGKDFLKQEMTFPSGFQITALSSNPDNIRSGHGYLAVDEAAYHKDLDAVLKAAGAYIMHGGRVSVFSSHHGSNSEFNHLVQEVRSGKRPGSLHTVTIDDALRDGLYRDVICLNQRKQWTPEGERRWRDWLFDFYKYSAAEELLCIPSRSGSQFLSDNLIDSAMKISHRPICLHLKDDFINLPEEKRQTIIYHFCLSQVDPVLRSSIDFEPWFVGLDFGRQEGGDLSAIAAGPLRKDMSREIRLIVEMRNVPGAYQTMVLHHICKNVKSLGSVCLDAAGPGTEVAERAYMEFRDKVRRVGLSKAKGGEGSWSEFWDQALPAYREGLEKGDILLPKDLDLRVDHQMFCMINGVPRLPNTSVKGSDGWPRHGDAAVACILFHHATRGGKVDEGEWMEGLDDESAWFSMGDDD